MTIREPRSKSVVVRFRPSRVAQLDAAAERENLTRSEFIREGVASLVLALQLGTHEETSGTSQSDGSASAGADSS